MLYSIVVLLVVIGVPELGFRLAGLPREDKEPAVGTRKFVTWLSDRSVDRAKTDQLYQADPDLLWRLRTDRVIHTTNFHRAPDGESQSVRITLNSEGHRGPAALPGDNTDLRVLCMGDSHFFGYPLDDQFVFPVQLNEVLNHRLFGKSVEVTNGGCPGYSTAQGRKWYTETFADVDYDWLLLSYLNNDAWRQPRADAELMNRPGASLPWLSDIAGASKVVTWMQSLNKTPTEQYVSRVPRDDFLDNYRWFLDDAAKKNAQVFILDFCFYPDYEPYSDALRDLAEQREVGYLRVGTEMEKAFQSPDSLRSYGSLLDQVRRRWGERMLAEKPYLWFYAEAYPEHLNEIGTTWLSRRIAREIITAAAEP